MITLFQFTYPFYKYRSNAILTKTYAYSSSTTSDPHCISLYPLFEPPLLPPLNPDHSELPDDPLDNPIIDLATYQNMVRTISRREEKIDLYFESLKKIYDFQRRGVSRQVADQELIDFRTGRLNPVEAHVQDSLAVFRDMFNRLEKFNLSLHVIEELYVYFTPLLARLEGSRKSTVVNGVIDILVKADEKNKKSNNKKDPQVSGKAYEDRAIDEATSLYLRADQVVNSLIYFNQ
jgi:hypothetical protein